MISRARIKQLADYGSSRGGFSIIEIVITLAVCLLLAAVAIPSAGSWLSEQRLREEVGRLCELVESARFTAMSSGVPRQVVIVSANDVKTRARSTEIDYFVEEAPFKWSVSLSRPGYRRVRISARGLVDPVEMRVENGAAWITFRFELLTGLPRDERTSF